MYQLLFWRTHIGSGYVSYPHHFRRIDGSSWNCLDDGTGWISWQSVFVDKWWQTTKKERSIKNCRHVSRILFIHFRRSYDGQLSFICDGHCWPPVSAYPPAVRLRRNRTSNPHPPAYM